MAAFSSTGFVRVLLWVGAAAVVIAAVLAAAFAYDTRGVPTTIRGLEIADRNATSLTREEVKSLVEDLAANVGATEVTINLPDGPSVLTADRLGIDIDREPLVDEAMAVGRSGGTMDRFWAWLASFTERQNLDYQLTYDEAVAAETVSSFHGLTLADPVEPRLVLRSDNELAVRAGEPGRRVDQGAIVSRLSDQVEAGGPFVVDAPTNEFGPNRDESELQSLADQLNVLTADGVTIRVGEEEAHIGAAALRVRLDVAGVDGQSFPDFDLESLQRLIEQLLANVESSHQDPEFDVVDDVPEVVEEGEPPQECCRPDSARIVAEAVLAERSGPVELQARPSEDPREVSWATGEEIVEKVAEFTTEHSCCQGRVDNIQRFADIVRGVYLTPGESLSLNEHVGQRTREKGFVPAGTIIRGHLVPTVGGGVSQFATTMFNAAFFAGFDFETYQSHSIYFSRYPYGREATISWPLPDLEFTNTTDYPALVWTSYTDTSITVSIYSTRSVEVEQIDQETSSVRSCTRVDTYRLRTYDDGREVEDSVFATYRPGEGLDCNGNPTDQPG